jgi:hypothetical protein
MADPGCGIKKIKEENLVCLEDHEITLEINLG